MRRWLGRIAWVIVALVVVLAAAGTYALRGSLPELDGRVQARGVGAAVRIERDARGSVTVTGETAADVAFALGFAHAQDRWFQMDLLRRASAGELSALLGPGTLDFDRSIRVHRFRAVARAALERASPQGRALLESYAAGANAGLASLRTRPFEYFVLRATPEDWRPEDSLLVALTMFVDLQGADGHHERQRGLVYAALPEAAARFVYGPAADWQAAIDGSRLDAVPPPPRELYDLGALGPLDFAPPPRRARARPPVGSNNWAVAGTRSATGTAIVANDMHLGLRVPNTWYHARLRHVRQGQVVSDVTGPTLPGTPSVVTGSNGRVAWAFTNSYGDYSDVIVAVPDPADPKRYLTPDGPQPFETVEEIIAVNGGEPERLPVTLTRWGPVVDRDAQGRALALQWTAHDPAAVNVELARLATAANVGDALAIAARAGIPGQNFVVGDASGRIAWTIAGQVPQRRGGDASLPRLSTDPTVGFTGWLSGEARPRLADPADAQIATANSRVVGGEALAAIGDGGYDRGARTSQIAAAVREGGDRQTARQQLGLQLDDRSLFLGHWKDLLAQLLDADAVNGQPRRAELRDVLRRWSGRAAVDDPAYRLVRAFREEVQRRVFYALIAPARAADPAFQFRIPASFEGPLWQLMQLRPAHLLPPGHADWRAFLLDSADAAVRELADDCPRLAECTWGRQNVVRIRHPLSAALPPLARWLDMPDVPLPGDVDVPRAQGRAFGASERFAVAVGHEADGYYHMPTGQSGHPLSRYYRAGHEDWVEGRPAPFLPGTAEHTLTLTP
jgi:penicillin amidase